MNDSILRSSFRAFCMVLFAILGVFVSIILIVLLLSLFGDSTVEQEKEFTPKILPNAEGIRKTFLTDVPVILQIDIDGVIGSDHLTDKHINQLLVESREGTLKDNRVKGILLHVKSPGGTVTDSHGIYLALKQYKEQYKLPVYAYIDGIGASGGMYIACAADKIYASDVSLIGSIGVIFSPFFNVTQLLEKIGIQSMTISAGKDKDLLSPVRSWKPGEEKQLQVLVDYFYGNFVDIITANRPKVDKTQLVDELGARIFDAPQAQSYGLIDGSGFTLKTAIKELMTEAKIVGDYQVIGFEKKNWYTDLFKAESSILQGKITHQLQLPTELDPKFNNQPLYLYRP